MANLSRRHTHGNGWKSGASPISMSSRFWLRRTGRWTVEPSLDGLSTEWALRTLGVRHSGRVQFADEDHHGVPPLDPCDTISFQPFTEPTMFGPSIQHRVSEFLKTGYAVEAAQLLVASREQRYHKDLRPLVRDCIEQLMLDATAAFDGRNLIVALESAKLAEQLLSLKNEHALLLSKIEAAVEEQQSAKSWEEQRLQQAQQFQEQGLRHGDRVSRLPSESRRSTSSPLGCCGSEETVRAISCRAETIA